MLKRIRQSILCLLPIVIIGGCVSLSKQGSSIAEARQIDSYQLLEGKLQSSYGCEFNYRLFKPTVPVSSTTIILGHGFLRSQDNMVGFGRAFANNGINIATLDFCNMRVWNGHHKRNADDMRTLANELGMPGNVIYAGFSAGALAAILAADSQTRAIVALDLVDQANLAVNAITQLQTPLIGLSGPASSCNASGNGSPVFKSRTDDTLSSLVYIDRGSHCEFESPSNWLCEITCGDDDSDAANQQTRELIEQRALELVKPFLVPIPAPAESQFSDASSTRLN